MAFIAGKGFAILNSKAEQGDQKAKDLLAKLDSIDQDEADRLFSEILGKGGGGGSKKDKKIKAPGASATDGQGKITEGDGEQAPTGKTKPKAKGEAPIAAPAEPTGEVKPKTNEQLYQEALAKVAAEKNPRKKEIAKKKLITGHDKKIGQIEKDLESFNTSTSKPADPLSNENLQALFDSGLDTDGVIDELRKQTSGLEADPENPLSNGDLQGIVEGFEMGYKPGNKQPAAPKRAKDDKFFDDAFDEGAMETKEEKLARYKKAGNTDFGDDELNLKNDEIMGEMSKALGNNDQQTYDQLLAQQNELFQNYYKKQEQPAAPTKEAGTSFEDVLERTGGKISGDDATKLANDYDLSVAEVYAIANEYKAEQGAGNVNDKEVADELGVDTEQLNELLKPTNTNTPENPEDPANVQQVLNSVGGDKAKALQIIKGQQAVKGGLQLNEKTIKEVINQVAAGETNVSLPAGPEPTAEQLAETDSLFENTPEQGAGNVNDKEVADELGVDEQELAELLGPNPLKTLGKTYQGAPWEEENIKNILQQAGGDKAKALELLKQQQENYKDKGPILKDQFLPGLIEQAAAGETNLSLPASDPTAEQLAETDSLFEQPLSPAEQQKINDQIANEPFEQPLTPEEQQQLAGIEQPMPSPKEWRQQGEQLRDDLINSEEVSFVEADVNEYGDIAAKLPNGNKVVIGTREDGTYDVLIFDENDEELENIETGEFGDLISVINEYGERSPLSPVETARMNELLNTPTPEPSNAIADVTDKIKTQNILAVTNDSVEGILPNGSQFIVDDTGEGLSYRIVNGPDGDTEPTNYSYEQAEEMFDDINRLGATGELDPETEAVFDEALREPVAAEPEFKTRDIRGPVAREFDKQLTPGFSIQIDDDNQEYLVDEETNQYYKIYKKPNGLLQLPELGRESKNIKSLAESLIGVRKIGKGTKFNKPKPAQAQSQIKQTAQANAQQAAPAAPAATTTPQPQKQQQQKPATAKPDRQKIEAASVTLGVDPDLLEELLGLLSRLK
jgi:hypothetical protein